MTISTATVGAIFARILQALSYCHMGASQTVAPSITDRARYYLDNRFQFPHDTCITPIVRLFPGVGYEPQIPNQTPFKSPTSLVGPSHCSLAVRHGYLEVQGEYLTDLQLVLIIRL